MLMTPCKCVWRSCGDRDADLVADATIATIQQRHLNDDYLVQRQSHHALARPAAAFRAPLGRGGGAGNTGWSTARSSSDKISLATAVLPPSSHYQGGGSFVRNS